jgi:hypothetical protein
LVWHIFTTAPNLTELELRFSHLKGRIESGPESDPGQPPEQSPQAILKLKTLVVICDQPFSSNLTKLMNDLIQNAVGLENVESREAHSNLPLLTSLRDFAPYLNKIKSLQICNVEPDQLLILIEMANRKENALRLDNFSLKEYCRQVPESVDLLYEFLMTQPLSLRTLEIELQRVTTRRSNPNHLHPAPLVPIPKLERLHTLAFTIMELGEKGTVRDFAGGYPLQFDGGKMRIACPNLKRFECNHDILLPPDEAEESQSDLVHHGITEFRLTSQNKRFQEGSLTEFRRWFPSVTHLELLLPESGDTFAPLWETWPDLLSLTLECEPYAENNNLQLDALLTGISETEFGNLKRDIRQNLGSKPMTLEFARGLLQKYQSTSGISDLQYLRKFTMKTHNTRRLTDRAGYFGFALASPTLQKIRLEPVTEYIDFTEPGPEMPISRECQELIQSALGPLVEIILEKSKTSIIY